MPKKQKYKITKSKRPARKLTNEKGRTFYDSRQPLLDIFSNGKFVGGIDEDDIFERRTLVSFQKTPLTETKARRVNFQLGGFVLLKRR